MPEEQSVGVLDGLGALLEPVMFSRPLNSENVLNQ